MPENIGVLEQYRGVIEEGKKVEKEMREKYYEGERPSGQEYE